ncbi:hypothetical protein WJX84_011165 [Apatococcus fuscideae]|uniref:Alpha-N-acetylglucosaminidase n=1 Tax=Apatococcus fuscideae TaxID=2026836 RepID=A0AAW1RMG6_9CHLO
MGNLQGWGGPLPQGYIDDQADLQVKILERMRAFGMTPVLPAFAGFVPQAVKDKFPGASITRLGNWGRFSQAFCCVHLLDPQDPLFRQIGQAFVEEMRQAWGKDSVGYYSADTFNEQSPPSNEPDYLRNASRGVYEAMQAGDDSAVWIQQAWLFYSDQAFWQPAQIQALLEGVPRERLVMLDLFAEVFPLWNRTEAFQGVPFIWCMLHNFGGNLEMYGNLRAVAKGPADALQELNMLGIGMCPEGIETNPVVYDLMPEWAYRKEPVKLDAWTEDYAVRRYGPSTPASATDAWALLLDTVYDCQDLHPDHNQDIPVSRPGLDHDEVAPHGLQPQLWYHQEKVVKAWQLLQKAAPDLEPQSTYRYDLIDVGRQVISKVGTALWKVICSAYKNKDLKALRAANQELLELLEDLETLLASHEGFLLGPRIEEARAAGNSTADKALFEWNLRTQITIWGTGEDNDSDVHDYANKEWAGLMQSFYRSRWSIWLHRLEADLVRGKEYDAVAVQKDFLSFTTGWTHRQDEEFSLEPSGNTVEISENLLTKSLGSAETETFIECLSDDLGRLLSQSNARFWQRAGNDSTLYSCLDSYVQFVRRPFDQEHSEAAEPSAAYRQLSKRIFMVITRLASTVSTSQPIQRKDRSEAATVTEAEQTRILRQQHLLSLPLLMDVCALYAPTNLMLVQELMQQAMCLLPELSQDLAERIGPMIASNLRDVCQACRGAVKRMGGKGTPAEMSGLADGLLYMVDTAYTMHAMEAPPGLLRAAAARCGLASDILASLQQGAIQLDEIQQDYLYALLGTTSAAARHDETQAMSSAASTSQGPPPPGDMEMAALISQIGDVLPEYGAGFLTACLEHYASQRS